MTQTLGEKIKNLRKELNLTQTELAGDMLTKSMLSQIENNQASPSMKTLKYLASRLGKSITYFLEDNSNNLHSTNVEIPLDGLTQDVLDINKLMENNDFKNALAAFENIFSKYEFNKNSILYSDIVLKHSICLISLNKFTECEANLRYILKNYLDNSSFIQGCKTLYWLMIIYLKKQDFNKALEIISEIWTIYNSSINKDVFFEIDILHKEALIYADIKEFEQSILKLEKALTLTNETNSYYKGGELHRLIAISYLTLKKYDEFKLHIKKAKEFALFSENKQTVAYIEINLAIFENLHNNPLKALEHISMAVDCLGNHTDFCYLEKGKAYYMLKKYDLALENLNLINLDVDYHSLDYIELCEGKIYAGLALHALGKSTEGIENIKNCINLLVNYPISDKLVFAYKTLSTIYSDINDFENAFYTLKKSNELINSLSQEGSITIYE